MENTRPPVTPLTINQKRRNMNTADFSINLILDLVLIQLTIDVSNWQFNSLISVDLMPSISGGSCWQKSSKTKHVSAHGGLWRTNLLVAVDVMTVEQDKWLSSSDRSPVVPWPNLVFFFFCCPSHAERASWSFLSFNVHLSRHHTWQLSNIPHNLDGHVVILEKEALPSGEKC